MGLGRVVTPPVVNGDSARRGKEISAAQNRANVNTLAAAAAVKILFFLNLFKISN
jgi:hypothetical protein